MSKPFSNLFNIKKDKKLSSSKNIPKHKGSEKSKSLIIFGFIISISSIFLLLFTINNKFGWSKGVTKSLKNIIKLI